MNNRCRSFRKGSSAFFFPCFISIFLFFFPLLKNGSGGELGAQMMDSIRSSFHKKPHLIGGFATKNTFIGGFRSPIFTARAGLDFNHLINMGIGVSWLKLSDYDADRNNIPFYIDKIISTPAGNDTVHPALQFRYVNLFFEYIYYKTGKWQFSIPLQVGLGDSNYKYKYQGSSFSDSKHIIFLYEPAVSGQYKIVKWFGVGLDVGYRIMIVSNKHIGGKFNSPIYDIKAIIFWGEIYNKLLGR